MRGIILLSNEISSNGWVHREVGTVLCSDDDKTAPPPVKPIFPWWDDCRCDICILYIHPLRCMIRDSSLNYQVRLSINTPFYSPVHQEAQDPEREKAETLDGMHMCKYHRYVYKWRTTLVDRQYYRERHATRIEREKTGRILPGERFAGSYPTRLGFCTGSDLGSHLSGDHTCQRLI